MSNISTLYPTNISTLYPNECFKLAYFQLTTINSGILKAVQDVFKPDSLEIKTRQGQEQFLYLELGYEQADGSTCFRYINENDYAFKTNFACEVYKNTEVLDPEKSLVANYWKDADKWAEMSHFIGKSTDCTYNSNSKIIKIQKFNTQFNVQVGDIVIRNIVENTIEKTKPSVIKTIYPSWIFCNYNN
jgi:hypothetical protein